MEHTDTAAKEDYRARVLLVDNGVRLLCQAQQADGTTDAGGFLCPERLCCEPLYTAFALSTLWRAYREPLSRFHHDPEIQNRMFAALAFLRRAQRDDGGLHFYAGGDADGAGTTARALNALGRDYDAMADGPDAMPADFLTSLGEFLRGGGRALVYGPAAPGDRLEVGDGADAPARSVAGPAVRRLRLGVHRGGRGYQRGRDVRRAQRRRGPGRG